MSTIPTVEQRRKIEALLSDFESTTQFLNALSGVVSLDYEDVPGGNLIASFAEVFEAHEETTL